VFDHRRGKPPLPQSGTFTANPITMTAGLASMKLLTPEAVAHLDRLGEMVRAGVAEIFRRRGMQAQVTGMGSIFKIHMHTRPILDHRSHFSSDAEIRALGHFQIELLKRGHLIATRGYGFIATPMTSADIDSFLSVVDEVAATFREANVA
jgi:glutamate-1-semialdehyde 2,1-aminomutase